MLRWVLPLLAMLPGCAAQVREPAIDEAWYGEPTVTFLADDLAQVTWDVGSKRPEDVLVDDGARAAVACALSEAIMLRGGGFARHVRTIVAEEGGISRADAIYTVSPTLPAGQFVIDAEVVAAQCRDQGTERV